MTRVSETKARRAATPRRKPVAAKPRSQSGSEATRMLRELREGAKALSDRAHRLLDRLA
ncbi:MAG: hypothetical protein JOZ42_06810 [Acetobacteraceae bacterium]|nr:hypothetical protein [Acetobacteraceae bacterium]